MKPSHLVGALVLGALVFPVGAANQAPTVSFLAPVNGQTVNGVLSGASCEAQATDDRGVKRVRFYFDGALLNADTSAPWNCTVDTRKYANGAHRLKAVAYDRSGLTGTSEITVQVDNGLSPGNARAVPTFESLGLYWTPPASPGAAGCTVRYRASGASAWRDGLPLWYDARNNECRGSLVHLAPGTSYEVQLGLPGQPPAAQLTAATWSESFPIAKIVYLPSGTRTTPLTISEGGSASGYVLYTFEPGGQSTIDVANAYDHNITISAPYVIVRGLTLRGARIHGIRLLQGAHNVVIEDNDISGWGRYRATSAEGWQLGVNTDSGIYAHCGSTPWLVRTIIQRNRIHHPRYGSNSWSDGHPEGPNAVYFANCGGNHVFRYNEVYSEWGRYFNDAWGGADNFSNAGMPNADSDLYGNILMHAWDDAIEAEGANRNVRIWSNYMDQTAVGIATSATHAGPVYIFRNVQNRSRQLHRNAPDNDEELGRAFQKAGSTTSYGGGRRYVFHNTALQAPPPQGSLYESGIGIGLKGNANQPLTNTVSRNNVYHIRKNWLASIDDRGGWDNDLDFDLFNGGVVAYPGAEANGILGVPIYAPGHGWSNEAGGSYQLDPSSPGYDRGARLPNFNDGFLGLAPDMGAHEGGSAPMRFGIGF